MAIYGSRTYGSFRYAGAPTDVSVYPFTAQPLDYGNIKLNWKFPSPTSTFNSFSIVRNPMGFPVTVDDGDLVYKNTYTNLTNVRTNLITNPSFETDVTGWASLRATSVTRNSSYFVKGSYSLSLQSSGGGPDGFYYVYPGAHIPVTAGQTYTYSVYVAQDAANPISKDFRAGIEFYDINGAGVITLNGTAVTPAIVTNGFTRISVSAIAPANATGVTLTIYSMSSTASGDVFYFDAALFEQSTTVNDYFDGSTPANNLTSYWSGTPNASSSVLSFLGSTGTLTDSGNFYDRVINKFNTTVTAINFGNTVNSKTVTLTPTAAASDRINLATNPSFDTTSGTVTVRTNKVINPSFELNNSFWASGQTGGVTRSSAFAYTGSYSGLTTITSASDTNIATWAQTDIVSGQTYTYSTYTYVPVGSPLAGRTLTVGIEGAGATYTTVGSLAAVLVAGSWVRSWITATATSSGSFTYVHRYSGASAVGSTIYTDAILLEQSFALGDYFDGSTTAAGDFTYAWTGTANASSSNQVGKWLQTGDVQSYYTAALYQSANAYTGIYAAAVNLQSTSGGTPHGIIIGATNLNGLVPTSSTVTVSAYVKGTVGQQIEVSGRAVNNAGAYIGEGYGAYIVTFDGTWQRVSVTYTVGSSAFRPGIQILTSPSLFIGNTTFYVDGVLIEQSSTLNTYFDGSSTLANYSTSWAGTTNASSSIATYIGPSNSSITPGQLINYTPNGYLTGANSGSGIVGGTRVTAVSSDSNGVYTLTLSDYATIPDGTTLTFSSTSLGLGKTYYYSAFVLAGGFWQRVGTALGTSIKNYKTTDVMYDSLPDIYKNSLNVSSSATSNKNVDLYNFLRTFGVQYDLIKTKVENAKNRYDVSNLDGRLVPALMSEMGFSYESGMGVQQGRRLLKHATDIYLNKGSVAGVKQFASSFTGYTATISPFVNLFLTLDCSSFEVGDGFWAPASSSTATVVTSYTYSGSTTYPVTSPYSPAGYPNSSKGFLKLDPSGTGLADYGSNYGFSYGVAPDSINISSDVSSTLTNTTDGGTIVTIYTTTEHGLKSGTNIAIQNSSVSWINGIWQILNVINSKSFTYYIPYTYVVYFSTTTTLGGTVSIYDPKLYGIPVTGGTSYTFSIYTKALVAGKTLTFGIKWYDVYGTYISSTTSTVATKTTAWLRLLVTSESTTASQRTPSNAVYAVPYVADSNTTIGNAYSTHYFDGAQFEAAVVKTGVSSYLTSLSVPSTAGIVPGSVVTITTDGTGTLAAYNGTTVKDVTTVTAVTNSTAITVNYAPSVQLSGATVTFTKPYQDARRVDLYLSPTRINYITNSSFEVSSSTVNVRVNNFINPSAEVDASGWSANLATIARITTDSYWGSASIEATYAGTAGDIWVRPTSGGLLPVVAGQPYTFSVYVKDVSTAKTFQVGLDWYTGTPAYISSNSSAFVTVSTSSWTRISVTVTAPSTATQVDFRIRANGTPTTGTKARFDAALFEQSAALGDYFDGSTTASGDFTYVWSGTANASTSIQQAPKLVGWFGPGAMVPYKTTATSYVGSSSAVLVNTNGGTYQYAANSSRIAVTPGQTYTLTYYIKNINSTAQWFSSLSGFVAATGGSRTLFNDSSRVSPNTSTWQRVTNTWTIPIGINYVETWIINDAGETVNGSVYVDAILLEQTSTANFYFDASAGYNNVDDVVWEQNAQGTKGTSSTGRSFYYPNRLLAQSRLDAVIDDYLPMGSSHALFIGTTAT